MTKTNEIVVATEEALAQKGGEVSKRLLVAEVEARLGRALKPVEAGLYVHEARKRFMRETKQEIASNGGKLSVATPEQSLKRRRSKNARAVRALRSNAEEMEILLSREDLTDEVRKSLQRLKDKTADTAIDLQSAERRKRRLLPGRG